MISFLRKRADEGARDATGRITSARDSRSSANWR